MRGRAGAAAVASLSLLTSVAGAIITDGAELGVAPCDAADDLQRLNVHAADGTVRSADGALCVTFAAPSPALLRMSTCVAGASNQTWTYIRRSSSFQGEDGSGACVAFNSQGPPGQPTRSLSSWPCSDLQWNGYFAPDAARGVIIANCTGPGSCDGSSHCVAASPVCVIGKPCLNTSYIVSDELGPSRPLDGIGGLSGGGAVARMLPAYDDVTRGEIFDYLFLPDFGASLHILKVEMGSDCQSTDGSEPTHMRNSTDECYTRGYEWMVMREAKRRNPDIKLYGLAWGWPQWITCNPGTLSNCTGNVYDHPEELTRYVVNWVAGAKAEHNLTIDWIGDWNERPYNDAWLIMLRGALDARALQSTRIVAPDQGGWGFAADVLADPSLAAAVAVLGTHYAGASAPSADAERTGKPLWSAEESSTYNNDVGAGCWARDINQNLVNGNVTASICWNLVSAYQKGTNWYRAGMMNAMQPWVRAYGSLAADGSWSAGPMIWATAHTTQFSRPGWRYLSVDAARGGSGRLRLGGSFVTLVDPATANFTIVIEKMSHDGSACVRPGLAPFVAAAETATFVLRGALARAASLNVWRTHWAGTEADPEPTAEFERLAPVAVVGGRVTLNLTADSLYTLTTLPGGGKGSFGAPPPPPTLFPTAHEDDFEGCPLTGEAPFFSDQSGALECVDSGDPVRGVVMQQMTPLKPVPSGGDVLPYSFLGARDAHNLSLVVDARITAAGASVMLGVRAQGFQDDAAVTVANAMLFVLWAASPARWAVYASVTAAEQGAAPVAAGDSPVAVAAGEWHTYRIDANGTSQLSVWVDGVAVVSTAAVALGSGHALLGTAAYGHHTQFDRVRLYSAYVACNGSPVLAAGAPVAVVNCNSEVGGSTGSTWRWLPTKPGSSSGAFVLRAAPTLCLSLSAASGLLELADCDGSGAAQRWLRTFGGVAPDTEQASSISNAAASSCVEVVGGVADVGRQMGAGRCSPSSPTKQQSFFFDAGAGEIANEWSATCAGVCA